MSRDEKEEIDDILNSLDHLQRAVANPFLFEKIKSRLESRKTPAGSKLVVRWALAAAFIVALNVVTWTQVRHDKGSSDPLNAIAGQLGFSNSSYQYP